MNIPPSWLEVGDKFSKLLGPPENYIIEQCTPDEKNIQLPSLCNGYIATDLTLPWMFLDGIYCGASTDSHRAAIPSPVFWLPSVDESVPCLQKSSLFHYGMGVHLSVQKYADFELQTTTFISRARPHLLVRSVEVIFSDSQGGPEEVLLKPSRVIDWETPDFDRSLNGTTTELLCFSGSVYEMEISEGLPTCDSVYLVTQMINQLASAGFRLNREKTSVCFLTAVSRSSHAEALAAYESALAMHLSTPDSLLEETANAWLEIWKTGRVTLESESTPSTEWEVLYTSEKGDVSSWGLPASTDELERSDFSISRCLIAAQYSMLCSFPDTQPDSLPMPLLSGDKASHCDFFGISPAGLARGNTPNDYQGHVFWDMDIWMLPWVSLFHPKFSEMAFNYRYLTMPSAEMRSKRECLMGARFPWESARTGVETSPWEPSANDEIHVVANISIALQQWLTTYAIRDQPTEAGLSWYTRFGENLMDSIARYWAARLDFSEEKEKYVILGVMPPDEYVPICDNSAYTNAAASLALAGPAKFSRLFDPTGTSVTATQQMWEELSTKIWMPFDVENKVMLEHENFSADKSVKQADAVLLNYPLMYPQSLEAKNNMLRKYAACTTLSGPAMTWSAFCISALELRLFDEADDYLQRCLLFCQMPFYVWTENRDRTGALNFLTGLGGFLQAVVYGYAGIRACLPVRSDDGTSVQALLISPQTPLPTLSQSDGKKNTLHLHGISFLGRRINASLKASSKRLELKLISGRPLIITKADATQLNVLCLDGDAKESWNISVDDPQPQSLPFMPYWLHE